MTDEPSGFARELVDLLRTLRAEAGNPSYREIARRAAVAAGYVNQVCNGMRRPTAQTASAIARALGASGEQQAKAAFYASGMQPADLRDRAPSGSTYLEAVRRIAPADLTGRDAELAELGAFCAADDPPGYLWWQADAWAGKSALLSTFVLDPPPGVVVVSFFITSRWANHNTRADFLAAVGTQLATVLASTARPELPPALHDAQFLEQLADAANVVRRRGRRLVLVVDGLDEDRGVGPGQYPHSIAALLPVAVPKGLRVVVSGRAHPPLPNDVPKEHPLRSPVVIRRLSTSPQATVVRVDAEHALRHLLQGKALGRTLLGLVTVCAGGLSQSDLITLAATSAWDVCDHLDTSAGRALTQRTSSWQSGSARSVYLLAHGELQRKAYDAFRVSEVASFRASLHRWAGDYRARGWPADTPGYLLRDYPAMLRQAGDLQRLIACVTDRGRHDRMLAVSGSDAAALDEVGRAQAVVLDQDRPDLLAMVNLAAHGNEIEQRNHGLPVELPAAWAELGEPDRAEALARALRSAEERAQAFELLATALAYRGEVERAERLALSIAVDSRRLEALEAVAQAWRDAGRDGDAQRLAEEVLDLDHAVGGARRISAAQQAAQQAKRTLTRALQATAGTAHAEQLTTRRFRGDAFLTALVEQLRRDGHTAQAADLADAMAADFRSELDPYAPSTDTEPRNLASVIEDAANRVDVLSDLITELAEAGDQDRARAVIDVTEPLLSRVARLLQDFVAERFAWALADAGEFDRAQQIRSRLNYRSFGLDLIAYFIRAAARRGDVATREQLISRYERAVPDAPGDGLLAREFAVVARAVAATGEPERARRMVLAAEAAARAGRHRANPLFWLTGLARGLALIGDARAGGMIDRARDHLTGGTSVSRDLFALLLAEAAVWSGDLARADALWKPDDIHPYDRVLPLVRALLSAGERERARAVADGSEGQHRDEALTLVLDAAVRADDLTSAEAIIAGRDGPHCGGGALVTALVAAGRLDRAEATARELTGVPAAWTRATIAVARAAGGDTNRAQGLTRAALHAFTSAPEDTRMGSVPDLIRALAATGERAQAASLADSAIARLHDSAKGAFWRTALACAIAQIGDPDRAEKVAASDAGEDGDYADTLLWTALVGTDSPGYRLRRAAWNDRAYATAAAMIGSRDFPDDGTISTYYIPPWDEAVRSLAENFAKGADPDRAERLVAKVRYHHQRHFMLAALAPIAATRGDVERAQRIISAVTGTEAEVAARFDVAEAFIERARTAPADDARRLVARAWSLGLWPLLFDGLARVDRELVTRLADRELPSR